MNQQAAGLGWATCPARLPPVQVNYQYELDRLQERNRGYLVDGQVAASASVEALLGGSASG